MLRHSLICNLFKSVYRFQYKCCWISTRRNYNTLEPPWKVLFFGTDDFSLHSLKALKEEYIKGDFVKNLEVVTSVKTKKNAVEKFALNQGLVLHNWPVECTLCREFQLGIVVSFGHLVPKDIIECFHFGMLNIHASLLPRWRGAAPIIHALANDDKYTGVSIMKIKPHHFDTGDIISQSSVEIHNNTSMLELHNTLARLGAQTLIKVLHDVPDVLNRSHLQPHDGVTFAPKVKPEMAQINWQTMSARSIYNLARALTGMFHLQTSFYDVPVKLQHLTECIDDKDVNSVVPGLISYNKNSRTLSIQCADGKWIEVKELKLPGKKFMSGADFYNGYLSKYPKHLRIFM